MSGYARYLDSHADETPRFMKRAATFPVSITLCRVAQAPPMPRRYVEGLSVEEWEQAWAVEIDRRLERHRTSQSAAQDLGEVLEGLRANR